MQPMVVRHTQQRVLVVGDRPAFTRRAELYLLRTGYWTIAITGYSDAWERIVKEPPDLIVLDATEPYRKNFALIQKLKAEGRTAHIRVMLPGREATGFFPGYAAVHVT